MSQAVKQDTRIHYLDSWRGIAAVMVVFFHLIVHFQNLLHSRDAYVIAARVLLDGPDWVSFFFVLSGFALSYGYIVSGKKMSVSDFYIKRLLRVYPLYLFALLLCYILERQSHSYSGMNLLREALLFPRFNSLLTPGWSLSIEICCSLVMPMIILLAISNKYHYCLVAIFSLLLYNTIDTISTASSGFFFHFFLGGGIAILLRDAKVKAKPFTHASPSLIRTLLVLLTCYVFFSMRWYIDFIPALSTPARLLRLVCDSINMDYQQIFFTTSGVASFIIIIATLRSRQLQRILSIRPFVLLGEISFSIYLMHWPIIKFVFPRIAPLLAGIITDHFLLTVVISVIIISTVIFVSFVTYHLIEKPFITLSKKIVNSRQYLAYREKTKNALSN